MTAKTKIPFACPWITDEDRQKVVEVLHRDVLTHGPEGKAFEEEFGQFLGGQACCVSVSSGMAALHLAYFDMGLKPGDEVLVPAQTHVATVHAVELMGAKPVFVDADPRTGNIDVHGLESLVNSRTKALSLVHFLGLPCDMDEILRTAEKHHLRVVEDCAIALGSRYRGTHVGLLGDAACFSFYPVKHITTGDGGMFVTRHKDVADRVRKARGFGVDRSFSERSIPGMYDVPTLGMNYRLSDINAALGRNQLRRLPEILKRRRTNFALLKSAIGRHEDIRILDAEEGNNEHSFYCLSVVLLGRYGRHRDAVVRKLNAAGVGTSVYYPQPIPRLAYYRNKYGDPGNRYPQATLISDQSIALPVGPHLEPEDMETIASRFNEILKEIGS
jgi:dTDP-4-amino-4,6-dideoxygalactose transaminase